MVTPTAHELRKSGYKVKIYHYRVPEDVVVRFGNYVGFDTDKLAFYPTQHLDQPYSRGVSSLTFTPYEFGGKTEVEITHLTGEVTHGTALCSLKDNFSYKVGTKIAIGRAMQVKHDLDIMTNIMKEVTG